MPPRHLYAQDPRKDVRVSLPDEDFQALAKLALSLGETASWRSVVQIITAEHWRLRQMDVIAPLPYAGKYDAMGMRTSQEQRLRRMAAEFQTFNHSRQISISALLHNIAVGTLVIEPIPVELPWRRSD